MALDGDGFVGTSRTLVLRERKRTEVTLRARLVAAAVVLIVVFASIGLRPIVTWFRLPSDNSAVKHVAQTERVHISYSNPDAASITLSPNDRWLVFTESAGAHEDASMADERELLERRHLEIVSIDTQSGRKLNHRLPPEADESEEPWQTHLGVQQEASWASDCFVLTLPGRDGRSLVLNPIAESLQFTRLTSVHLACSDSPPYELIANAEWMERVGLGGRRSAGRNWGQLDAALFYTHDGIWRATSQGHKEELVSIKSLRRFGMETDIFKLRVSPSGRYLAYSVGRSLETPFLPGSAWIEFLYVKDLETKHVVLLAARADLSNVIWSGDSQLLYFAGRNPSRPVAGGMGATGVYVAHVANAVVGQ